MANNISVLDSNSAAQTVKTTDESGVHVPHRHAELYVNGADVDADNPVPSSDAGPSWTSSFGVSGARFTSSDATTAADVTDAPDSGEKLVITDLTVSVDTEMRVDLQEETSGTVLYSFYLPANGTIQVTPRGKMKLATADKKLQVQASAAGNIAVTAFYFSE